MRIACILLLLIVLASCGSPHQRVQKTALISGVSVLDAINKIQSA